MSEFSAPDFSVPDLSMTELAMPDFTMPDASLPDPPTSVLLHPTIPADLDLLAGSASTDAVSGLPVAMPGASEMLQVSQTQDMVYDPICDMPGTFSDAALSLISQSPDNRQLPDGLAFDALHSTPGMTTRERHLGMLLLGLEGKGPVEGMEGTGR